MKKLLTFFAILLSINAFGQWTTANLPGGKASMGAVAYGSKVWFGGGSTNNEDTKAVDIYDLSTGEWTVEQLSIPREFAAAGAAGGKVLFAGGINFWTFEHYSRVDIFDTQTHVWTTAELPEQKFDVAAVSYGDRVFFAGGVNLATGVNSAAVDIYNTTTGQWSTASLSEAGAVRAVVSGSKLVFVGASVMDIYDAATDTWTTETLPDARLFSGVTLVGNQIFIAGGMHFDNTPTNRVDIYNLTTGTWTMSSLSAPRGFLNNAVTVCGKAFFAGGGTFDLNTNAWVAGSNRVDIFDSATGEWSTDQLSHSVVNHSVVANGNQVLIAGGVENDMVIPAVDIYTCGSVVSDVWQTQNPNYPPDDHLFGLLVSIANENVAWTAGEAGDCSVAPWAFGLTQNDFARTTNGGQTWTSGTYPTSGVAITTDLFALDSNVAWLTVIDFVEGNKLLKTTDGGQTWIPQNINVTVYIDFVYFFGSGVGVVVGDPDSLGFEIFWTSTGGASWQRVNPATLPPILPGEFTFPFHSVEGSNVWFVTQYGRVFHSPSKGATWEVWPAPNVPLAGFPDYITCHDNTCLVSFGDYSDTVTHINKFQLFRTSDKGVTWEDITPADNNYALTGMHFVPNTGTLIGAFTHHNVNGPFETRISHDNGTTWQTIDEGTKILTLFFYNATTGYGTHLNSTNDPTVIYRYTGAPLTGLMEHKSLDATISVNPNPTTDIVRVHVQGATPGDYLLTVSDALGRVVHIETIENQSSFEKSVDLSRTPAGVYWVNLSNGVGNTCSKVVKQ